MNITLDEMMGVQKKRTQQLETLLIRKELGTSKDRDGEQIENLRKQISQGKIDIAQKTLEVRVNRKTRLIAKLAQTTDEVEINELKVKIAQDTINIAKAEQNIHQVKMLFALGLL